MEKRNTVQRELVLNAVRKLGCHATADEIYSEVSAAYPSVSRGTVYRNLKVLSEEGVIGRVEVPDGADHFDHNCGEHYHAQCVCCGRVFDVELSDTPDLMKLVRASSGISIDGFKICFEGTCEDCKTEEKGEQK